jgi:hypothetical protein
MSSSSQLEPYTLEQLGALMEIQKIEDEHFPVAHHAFCTKRAVRKLAKLFPKAEPSVITTGLNVFGSSLYGIPVYIDKKLKGTQVRIEDKKNRILYEGSL